MEEHQTSTAPGRPDTLEVLRSEEHLVLAQRTRPTGRVRIAKRVVTEERTVTVTVRREELVVEQLPLEGQPTTDGELSTLVGHADDGAPVLEVLLSEEEVRPTVVVVPRERVRVYVDVVTGTTTVAADLAREVVDLDTDPGVTTAPSRTNPQTASPTAQTQERTS